MIKRFFQWRQRQTPKTKLLIAYLFNVLLLIGVNIFCYSLWPHELWKGFGNHLAKALLTGVFFTLFFNSTEVRSAFKKSKT